MKVLVVTTPIRPVPTTYPPIGTLCLLKYLRRHGFDDVELYDIDGNRPAYEEALAHIVASRPDVLGISSVVSTAYAYAKRLSLDVKKALPETLIVLGGNLAASAEILLRRTGVDLCALGEGEMVFLNVVRRAATTRTPADFADIPGLMLLDDRDRLVNTGFETPLAAEGIYDLDWDDLKHSSDIDMFVYPAFGEDGLEQVFRDDPRAYEPARRHKKETTLVASKGCVARCTFCHRWDKGIRYVPVDTLMRRIDDLIERYDVGFLQMGDENFGTHHEWLDEFCRQVAGRDLLWAVKGMRVNRITPEKIAAMKDAGCTSIVYGMESGSERMLEVMEKKVKLQHNYDALKWTVNAGLFTVVQLVIGMPGESPESIRETIEFCKFGSAIDAGQNSNDLSINYAQALPGTPLYEYGRHAGLIGEDMDGEEEYLLRISDRDAHDEETTLNFTEYPSLECQTWRLLISIEANYAYVQRYGIGNYRNMLLKDTKYFTRKPKDTGYFANPKRLVDTAVATDSVHGVQAAYELDSDAAGFPRLWTLIRRRQFGLAKICYPVLFYRLRRFLPALVVLRDYGKMPPGHNARYVGEYLSFKLGLAGKRSKFGRVDKSLRRHMNHDIGALANDSQEMALLRRGR